MAVTLSKREKASLNSEIWSFVSWSYIGSARNAKIGWTYTHCCNIFREERERGLRCPLAAGENLTWQFPMLMLSVGRGTGEGACVVRACKGPNFKETKTVSRYHNFWWRFPETRGVEIERMKLSHRVIVTDSGISMQVQSTNTLCLQNLFTIINYNYTSPLCRGITSFRAVGR